MGRGEAATLSLTGIRKLVETTEIESIRRLMKDGPGVAFHQSYGAG